MGIAYPLVDPTLLTDRLSFSMGIGHAGANRQQRRHFRGTDIKVFFEKTLISYVCPRRLAVALAPPPTINTGRALSDGLLPRQTPQPLPFELPEFLCRGNLIVFYYLYCSYYVVFEIASVATPHNTRRMLANGS